MWRFNFRIKATSRCFSDGQKISLWFHAIVLENIQTVATDRENTLIMLLKELTSSFAWYTGFANCSQNKCSLTFFNTFAKTVMFNSMSAYRTAVKTVSKKTRVFPDCFQIKNFWWRKRFADWLKKYFSEENFFKVFELYIFGTNKELFKQIRCEALTQYLDVLQITLVSMLFDGLHNDFSHLNTIERF